MHKVFVYGTLKKGEPNHHWLTNPDNGVANLLYRGTTSQKFPLVIATKYNIPFLLYAPGKGHYVEGEVYEVCSRMLSKLDELEAHPTFYQRTMGTLIPYSDQKTTDSCQSDHLDCWIYFIKNFKPSLLDLEMLESYSSLGPHGKPYLERSKRDPSYDHVAEILDS